MDLKPSLRTPIKRARGLGAAHSGTHHFWVQRVSAVALIPLTIWFMVAMLTALVGVDRAGVAGWLSSPSAALLLGALLVALFLHARLGIQTIIEDYVHAEGLKISLLMLLNFMVFGFGAAALMAIAHMHFITR